MQKSGLFGASISNRLKPAELVRARRNLLALSRVKLGARAPARALTQPGESPRQAEGYCVVATRGGSCWR